MPNGGGTRKLNFSMFSLVLIDKITALKHAFIVFSKEKKTFFWCMFIVYTLINGIIQCIASIIESSFFIVNITGFS